MKTPCEPASDDHPSDGAVQPHALEAIVGLGERSMRKSYYPELRRRLSELERFRTLFDSGNDLILLVELPEWRIVDANAPACQRLGWASGDLVGKPLSAVDNPLALSAALEGDDSPVCIMTMLTRRDGILLPVELTCRIATADGKRFALLVARDITDRLRFETELRAAKDRAERAGQAKSSFLAAASHDLRQPAQALMLCADVLAHHTSPAGAPALAHLRQSLGVMNSLLDSLLEVSQIDAGLVVTKAQDVPLGPLLAALAAEAAPLAAAKGLAFRLLPCRSTVRSDADLLRRILRHLLLNALKYTRHGRVLLGCRRRGTLLRIEVWDTGPGIPPDRQEDIFEDFVQLANPERDRAKGLGLGLAVANRLARLLGHPIDVRSRLGEGSAFSVSVPLV